MYAIGILFKPTLLFAVACAIVGCSEPTPVTTPLAPPDATSNAEFSDLISVRELSDGRVLTSDQKDSRIAIVDFVKNTSNTIGRSGEGPGEYTRVGRLWPMGADSTFMAEPYSNRWHVAVADKIVETTSDISVRVYPNSIVRGVNARREILGIEYARNANGRMSQDDSSFVVRIAWSGTPHDTVGRLAQDVRESADDGVPAAKGRPTGAIESGLCR